MDTELRRRHKSPVAELTARVRMGDDRRALGPCSHCGAARDVVTVGCPLPRNEAGRRMPAQSRRGRDLNIHPHLLCNGTGRVPWPWEGDTGRLALAAYAGDEAARVLVPHDCVVCSDTGGHRDGEDWVSCNFCPHFHDPAGREACHGACNGLGAWLRNLDRWPGAMLVGAIGATRAVHEWLDECDLDGHAGWGECRIVKALDAASGYAHCSCEASRKACRWAWETGGQIGAILRLLHVFIRVPTLPIAKTRARLFELAVEVTDEPTIRAAVCEALRGWALTGVL